MKTKVIISGSNKFNDKAILESTMFDFINEHLFEHIEIISGSAQTMDDMAQEYAKEHKITYTRFETDWENNGNRAGLVRNIDMINYALKDSDCAVLMVFDDGKNSVVRHIIENATNRGFEVIIINVK